MNFPDKSSLIPLAGRILYEDNHLILVNKRPSEIVQGDKTGDEPLSEAVKRYIKERYHKPGEVFLGVVHRLDRPVSGVVIFARTSKALARLNQMMKDRSIQKIYWAIVKEMPPEEEATLVNFLRKNQEKNKSMVFNTEVPASSRAELRYRILASSDNFYLLEVELMTGRHHQIRAQLAHIGCPVRGDMKYGYPRPNPDASLHLHARSVSFIHPVKDQRLQVAAPPPDESLWNYFASLNL